MLDDIRIKKLFTENVDFRIYDRLFKYAKTRDKFKFLFTRHKCKRIHDLTFEQVIVIKRKLQSKEIKIQDVLHVLKSFYPSWIPLRLFLWMRVSQFYPVYNHIMSQLQQAIEAENASWSPQYQDPDFKRAGAERLAAFKDYNILAEIADKYKVKPSDILEWSYGEVFMEVARNTINADVTKTYHDIKQSKAKS